MAYKGKTQTLINKEIIKHLLRLIWEVKFGYHDFTHASVEMETSIPIDIPSSQIENRFQTRRKIVTIIMEDSDE